MGSYNPIRSAEYVHSLNTDAAAPLKNPSIDSSLNILIAVLRNVEYLVSAYC